MKFVRFALPIAILVFAAFPAFGQTGPVYPPPGGNLFSSSGASGSGTGATLKYSGFDSTAYSQLWWGPTSVQNVCNANSSSSCGSMSYTGYNSSTGVAEWDSTSMWSYTDGFNGSHNYNTRLLLQFQPAGTTGGIGSTFLPATTIGPAPGAVLQVTGNFQAQVLFEADVNNTWTPVLNEYNSINESQANAPVQTSLNGGFWSTPPASPTPEPAGLLYMGSGLLGIGGWIRRRRASRS